MRIGSWELGIEDWLPSRNSRKAEPGDSIRLSVDISSLNTFATSYAAAWCSHEPGRVASFFAEDGSLSINGGAPSVGRAAIAAAANEFMTAFPDMVVTMDGLAIEDSHAIFRWTLDGTNTGTGGTGQAVRISGYEKWTFGADGLIAASLGHFDAADYQRQLQAQA